MDFFQELEQINKAISAIYAGGQSYTINSGGASRQVTMADLSFLLSRKKELKYLLSLQSGGASVRVVPGW
jgi:hypothetical protein